MPFPSAAVLLRTLHEGATGAWERAKRHAAQLLVVSLLVALTGAGLKFQTFPMPWIAAQSKCMQEITIAPTSASTASFTSGTMRYKPIAWIREDPNCKEDQTVFHYVSESYTATTSYFIFFGLAKALFNVLTGVACDRFGRKWTLVAGWALGIPMPLMVIFAESWWTAAASNIFLGMQQALVWGVTIIIMIDYLGHSNAGIAVGINETVGYTVIALMTPVAVALLDEGRPREVNYYVVIGLVGVGLALGIFFLHESCSPSSDAALGTGRSFETTVGSRGASLTWPSGRQAEFGLTKSAFVYTSCIKSSLWSICFAGLIVNVISGFAWGLFVKWMKSDYVIDGELKWTALSKESIANIMLCYGIPKGVLQWFFGLIGDRAGRRWIITAGLVVCTVGLLVIAVAGETSGEPVVGFAAGALLMGVGTSMMYSNNVAAVSDHADPSWRSSALGAYRFWRDMGFAVGALITGMFADSTSIFGSAVLVAVFTALAALSVGVFFLEAEPTDPETSEAPKAVGTGHTEEAKRPSSEHTI